MKKQFSYLECYYLSTTFNMNRNIACALVILFTVYCLIEDGYAFKCYDCRDIDKPCDASANSKQQECPDGGKCFMLSTKVYINKKKNLTKDLYWRGCMNNGNKKCDVFKTSNTLDDTFKCDKCDGPLCNNEDFTPLS